MLTIIGGFHLAGESHSTLDKCAKDARTPPQNKCIGLKSDLPSMQEESSKT